MIGFELSDEQKAIRDLADTFARKEILPIAAELDRTMAYPMELVKKAHAAGLLNPSIPAEYGGAGLNTLEQAIISESIGYACTGVGTAFAANDLALAPLLVAGTKEQITEFATPMTKEPLLAAYCVTEPGAGSDVAGIRTTAKDMGDHFVLNGSKMWITNGSVASWYFVLATLDPAKGPKGMCGFVLPAKTPGIQVGKKEINVGQRCSDTRGITFDNVKVPKKYLLGKPGEGFKIAMAAFDHTRPLVAAGAVGLAQRAFDEATRYALERKAFGVPIAQHQAVQFMLADMAKDIEAARLLVWRAAWELDQGRRNTKFASFAKCFAGDAAVRIASDAVQIFGGYGYNNEYPVEKLYRDSKIFQIYEGTQQIQRVIIARHVLEEAGARG
jgi:acyl-CoA dehydrogenase